MPRSPARDLSDRYTGQRGYIRQPDGIRRGKYALMVVGILAVGVWAAADITKPQRAIYAHTHGQLTESHAAFDDNCAACHVSHTPGEFSVSSVFQARDRWHDFTCERCHGGPVHHKSINAEGQKFHNTCSNCHHDHNGRANSLVRISDSHCTLCHGNISTWHTAQLGQRAYAQKVTHFVTDHPEFVPLNGGKPIDRTLIFSHAVHMTPGQLYDSKQRGPWTIGDIRRVSDDVIAERYRKVGESDSSPVRLECASCHNLDSGTTGTLDQKQETKPTEFEQWKGELTKMGQPTRALLPPRAEGAYFLGINYDAHCRACHPLKAPSKSITFDEKQFLIPGFTVPHRRQQADLTSDLKAGYLKGLIASDHPALKLLAQPGGKIEPKLDQELYRLLQKDQLALMTAQDSINEQVGCAKCHKLTGKEDTLRIAPVPDRTVWFAHAKFNHVSHRAATCATCHPGTDGRSISPAKANEPEPAQIEGIDKCRTCHSPPSTRITLPDGSERAGGGVRHGCADCHRYHGNDHPLQGLGAPPRQPQKPLELGEFLKGR